MRSGSHPPKPPLRKGGKVSGVPFFPPCEGSAVRVLQPKPVSPQEQVRKGFKGDSQTLDRCILQHAEFLTCCVPGVTCQSGSFVSDQKRAGALLSTNTGPVRLLEDPDSTAF